MIGQLLADRYRVTQVLATETYLASDTHRPGYPLCVIKPWQPDVSSNEIPNLKLLLERRLETLASLGRHPQIPLFRAFFARNDTLYQVEEFITGHPLSRELKPIVPWSELRLSRLLQEVLAVLVFAHRQGVIHQDLQPASLIRRQSDGRLELINWLTMPSGRFTSVPILAYVPPEQRQGNPLFNSDLYALGVIAIQALTGVAPENLPDLLRPEGGQDWPDRCQVSPKLAEVINRMTELDFRHRYQSAQEVLQHLQPVPLGPTSVIHVARRPSIVVPSAEQIAMNTAAVVPQVDLARAELAQAGLTWPEEPLLEQKNGRRNGVTAAPLPPALITLSAGHQLRQQRWWLIAAALVGGGLLVYGLMAVSGGKWPLASSSPRLSSDLPMVIQQADRAIQANPHDRDAYYQRGMAHTQMQQFQLALADFTQALQIEPTDRQAYFQRGQTRFKLGDAQGAIEDYSEAIALDAQQAPFYLQRGIALMAMGENLLAQTEFDRAIQLDPRLAIAYLSRCQAKSRLNDPASAIADCTQAANLDPTLVAAYQNRGIAHRQSGHLQTAIADFNLSLRLRPDDAVAYYQRGLTRKVLGDVKGAIADLDTTLQQNPDYALAYYERALLKAKLGQRSTAIHDLQTAADQCIAQGMTGCYRESQLQLKKLAP